jgi:hypothetical protein
LCCFNKFVDYDSCRGNTAQALARWQHPVASSEALDVLHWAMRLATYRCIAMAIEIASNLSAFFVAVNSLFATTISKRPCYDQYKINKSYQYVH